MSDLQTGAPQASSTGLAPNLAAALSYLFPPIGGIVLFVIEKESRFVRFHAAQAIMVGLALFAVWLVVTLVIGIVGIVPLLGGMVAALLTFAVGAGAFLLWLVLTWRAWQGEEWQLPVLGDYARNLLGSGVANG
jgi:uncharacterized membrane protein